MMPLAFKMHFYHQVYIDQVSFTPRVFFDLCQALYLYIFYNTQLAGWIDLLGKLTCWASKAWFTGQVSRTKLGLDLGVAKQANLASFGSPYLWSAIDKRVRSFNPPRHIACRWVGGRATTVFLNIFKNFIFFIYKICLYIYL